MGSAAGQAEEPGLQDALRTLQESLRQDFAKFLQRNYANWLRDGRSDRPPLSVDIGAEFLRPALQSHGKALLVVVDCLRLDQWAMIRPLIGELFDIETSHYFSILPTATPYARNAIFSGLFPSEIKQRYPKWWADQDENSLNAHEGQLLVEQLKDICGTPVPVRYEKVFSAQDGEALLRRLPAHLQQPGVTALVFNFIDQLTHGRSENSTLFEVARDTRALRALTRTWFERSPLLDALREAERRGVPVLLTTDHGSIHCHTPATVFAKRDATSNLRYKFGEDLRAQDDDAAIVVDDLLSFGLPPRAPGHPAPARHRRSLLRLSHEAARVPGPLSRRLPPRRRRARRSRPPDRLAAAEARLAVRNETTRLLALARPYRGLLAGALFCSFIASALDGITIVLLVPLLKHLFGTTGALRVGATPLERWLTDTFSPLLANATPGQAVARMAVVLGAGLLLKNLADYASSQFNTRMQEGLVASLRRKLYDHLLRLDLGFFHRTRTGLLVTALINETDQAKGIVTASMVTLDPERLPAWPRRCSSSRAFRSA